MKNLTYLLIAGGALGQVNILKLVGYPYEESNTIEDSLEPEMEHTKKGKVTYTLSKTSLGNPISLEATTERYCVYCENLMDPNLLHPDYPEGVGECYFEAATSFNSTCEHWKPNEKIRYWLSKGYMEHNREGWPRKPWYQVFDDGPDGEKGTR